VQKWATGWSSTATFNQQVFELDEGPDVAAVQGQSNESILKDLLGVIVHSTH